MGSQCHLGSISDCFPDKAVMTTLTQHIAELASAGSSFGTDRPFFVVDLGVVYRKIMQWRIVLPDVTPHYAVKCNSDPTVLRLLADLGAGFDCASDDEIKSTLDLNIESRRIIYAQPFKTVSGLELARSAGIRRMTFDSADELEKISQTPGRFELLLRIWTEHHGDEAHLSQKFGAQLTEVRSLLSCARRLGLSVVGIAFHVGTRASDPGVFAKAIRDSCEAFRRASEIDNPLHVLDIGGGFTSQSFEECGKVIRKTINEQAFPEHLEIIAEPGRLFVEEAFTLACRVQGRRTPLEDDTSGAPTMLYLSDGIFGSFANVVWESQRLSPGVVNTSHADCPGDTCPNTDEEHRVYKAHTYTLWGPTCDGNDRIMKLWQSDCDVRIGHWLYFPRMGAYSSSCKTRFNGFGDMQKPVYLSHDERVVLGMEGWTVASEE